MSTKRMLLTILAVSVVLLALAFGSQLAGARPSAQQPSPPGARPEHSRGVTIPYRLADAAGQPVADGAYDFTFALYDTETGGEPLWSEVQEGVAVQEGGFNALLGNVNDIPTQVLEGGERWLEVAVRGPGEAGFTALAPRQRLSAAAPPAPALSSVEGPDSPSAGLTCEHDHFGESWSGSSNNYALRLAQSGSGDGVYVSQYGDGRAGFFGINNVGNTKPALEATTNGSGYAVHATGDLGVYGGGDNGPGVEGHSTNGYGVLAYSANNDSIRVNGAGLYALNIQSSGSSAINVQSAGWDGMTIASAYHDGIMILSAGDDGVHVNPTIGSGICYKCGFKEAPGFVVLNTGEVRSDVGYGTPARDFAVMMDVEGTKASYEPGDVLVASDTGKGTLTRSDKPHSGAVVGVYSAAPGFLGGRPVSDKQVSGVPVVILGVVSCKVSAESGPIRPGDLLVTSSTPGHAMRADRDSASPGTVLGKALESLDASQGTGVILVLVTLQ